VAKKWVKGLYYVSIVCLIGSSELFVGVYFSDVLELYGIITIGALCLFAALFIIHQSLPKNTLENELN